MTQIILSNSSDKPLYRQIVEQARRAIVDGELMPGEALPSIRVMAADLSISVITTKRAYDELEKEALIETIPGKGCFVASNDNPVLRERRLRLLEELLEGALKQAAYLGISRRELAEMMKVLEESDSEADSYS